jgi:hypothetical protein
VEDCELVIEVPDEVDEMGATIWTVLLVPILVFLGLNEIIRTSMEASLVLLNRILTQ